MEACSIIQIIVGSWGWGCCCVSCDQQEKCPQSPAKDLYITMLEANVSTEEFVALVLWNPYWSCCVCTQPNHISLLFLYNKPLFSFFNYLGY